MSDGSVSSEEVRHVAGLARVSLTDEETERFAAQFGEVLEAFERLDEVPETEREPELVNVMREDAVREGLGHDEALRNAPEREDGYFRGPPVS
jgi:aspartyl-tRNA(Asn)/glutamyl-tRNA(Gln) amidotransferase subunit C